MKMYEISEKQIYRLKDICDYFKKEHSNFTTMQSLQMQALDEIVSHLEDIFSGYAQDNYQDISSDVVAEIINTKKPLGKFIYTDANLDMYLAIDNPIGDPQAEWFKVKQDAIDWLSDY